MKAKKHKYKCRVCGGMGSKSKGFSDAYGIPNELGDKTILQGKGNLVNCIKCNDCGHSWINKSDV